ncbi:MAG: PilZ domain-containing protein [Spirochaetaceae bacterium]|nr:PilZ domain-containing protein [Spirochaetaceae bacterium]
MGIETNRIETEFILKSISDKAILVTIQMKKKNVSGKVISYKLEKSITIQLSQEDKKLLNADDKVNIYFSYFNHVMNFSVTITEITDKHIVLSYPQKIYKNLSRKYVRVAPPENSKIVFSMKGEKFQLDFPKTEEFNAVDYPEFNAEGFSINNISQLVNDFKKKILEAVSNVNIITYRKQKPEAIEEILLALSGKVLYIPSVNKELSLFFEIENIPILTRDTIDSYVPDAQKLLKESNSEKYLKGIHSELYCPILYLEYVVGYIHLQNKGLKQTKIKNDIIEYTHQFSKILAFSLKVSGYFNQGKTEVQERYENTIVDISASGLLFESNSKKLEKSIFLYSDIKIELIFGNKNIPVTSRVMRKFKNGDNTFFGLIFLEMDLKDFEYLFYLVYGREITEEDREKWEGGSAPPQVDI